MSSALALASVTAVLKSLLDNRLIERSVATTIGEVSVSALPPDRIPIGADERSQLNLFMYRVSSHSGWRRVGVKNGDQEASFRPRDIAWEQYLTAEAGANGHARSASALSAPPGYLGLDIYYLVTAYGSQDFHAEILLGYAMQLLLETPFLTRDAIRGALGRAVNGNGGVQPPALAALASSTLPDQLEQIELTPEFISTEESSKLWSALQAHYRPSATYKASVVILDKEPAAPGRAAASASRHR